MQYLLVFDYIANWPYFIDQLLKIMNVKNYANYTNSGSSSYSFKELRSKKIILFGFLFKIICQKQATSMIISIFWYTHIHVEVSCFPLDTEHERTLNQWLSNHEAMKNKHSNKVLHYLIINAERVCHLHVESNKRSINCYVNYSVNNCYNKAYSHTKNNMNTHNGFSNRLI